MSLLTCQNVSFSYEGKEVLRDVNFTLEQGDYLCIVGENGAGKSTLLKGLVNLKKPASGQILTGDGLKRDEIGYLPQQTAAQKDFPASVEEVILSGCLNGLKGRLFYSQKQKALAEKRMKELGLISMRRHCYRDLSGGQQQRVLLARALCATKKLLLLDEPVSGLDPVVSQELYQLIRELNERENITIIMVSHDIRDAIRDAGHVLHLGSRQLFYGTKEAYRKSEYGRIFLHESDVL